MKILFVLLAGLLSVGVLSCKSSQTATSGPSVRPLTVGAVPFELPKQQDFNALDARVTADNHLLVRVALPPACKKAPLQVAMTWDGRVKKRMPPIATLRFVHEQLDACDAPRTTKVYLFDLSPLDKFRGKRGNPIILDLPAFNAKLAYPKQPTE